MLSNPWVLEPGGEFGASRDDWLNISLSSSPYFRSQAIERAYFVAPKDFKSAFDSDTTCNGNHNPQTRIELRRSANGAVTIILETRTGQSLYS